MPKILILFAHPRLEKSRANISLVRKIPQVPGITFHDLYEVYPDFNIDIEAEKALLLAHDIIIWHHPIFWYSCPALLKQWIDMVLEFGWAYGPGGNMLAGKIIFNAITTGGGSEAYSPSGYNRFTITQFLAPFDQTATLCKMIYLPPFLMQATHRLTEQSLVEQTTLYQLLLEKLHDGDFDVQHALELTSLNELPESINQ
ncbi:MAG TPA: NAD(P)H-dependent oxidoreductase [Flavitalea sp.]|nr:NAD(P)H-dependent oxidoreductase [Flavitalea sp.]